MIRVVAGPAERDITLDRWLHAAFETGGWVRLPGAQEIGGTWVITYAPDDWVPPFLRQSEYGR